MLAEGSLGLDLVEPRFDRTDNAPGDAVLKVEDLVVRAVEFVRPDGAVVYCVDQLSGDAQPRELAANAALDDIAHAKFRGDVARVHLMVAVAQGGVAWDDVVGTTAREAAGD